MMDIFECGNKKIDRDEIGAACCTCRGEDTRIQGFGGKT
jgi:hypothetical protein